MSRSRKKHAYVWITKKWQKWNESAFRRRIKRALHEVEIDFDPDRDWEEANIAHKKAGGEMGTKCGFSVKPDPDDSLWEHGWYEEMLRK